MENSEKHKYNAVNIKTEKEFINHVSEEMRKMYPNFYENWNQLIKRSETLKTKLREQLK